MRTLVMLHSGWRRSERKRSPTPGCRSQEAACVADGPAKQKAETQGLQSTTRSASSALRSAQAEAAGGVSGGLSPPMRPGASRFERPMNGAPSTVRLVEVARRRDPARRGALHAPTREPAFEARSDATAQILHEIHGASPASREPRRAYFALGLLRWRLSDGHKMSRSVAWLNPVVWPQILFLADNSIVRRL